MNYGRYLLIVLACLPLVWLTVSTVAALNSDQTAATAPAGSPGMGSETRRAAIDPAEVRQQADAAAARYQADAPVARLFRDADLYTPQSASASDAKSSLRSIAEHWRQTQAAGGLAVKIRDVFSPRDRGERLRRLQAFLGERQAFAKVRGSAEVFAHLEKLVGQMQLQIAVAKQYGEAVNLFNAEKYTQSLEKLGAIAVDTIDDLKSRERLETSIAALQSRNRFWLDWTALRGGTHRGDLPGLEGLRDAVAKFLKVHRPPQRGDEETFASAERWLAAVEARIGEEQAKRALAEQIAALSKADNFNALVDGVTDACAKIDKSATLDAAAKVQQKRQVQAALNRWLSTVAFPRYDPPAGITGQVQEAVLGNGQRLLGEFELPNGLLSWRFWKWNGPRDRKNQPDGEERFGDNGFEPGQKPHKPMYVQWATEYNNTSVSLSQTGTRAQWRAFLERCQAMERDLEAYRTRFKRVLAGHEDKPDSPWEEPDQACRSWRFMPAPTILPYTDLDDLSQRLERLQQMVKSANP